MTTFRKQLKQRLAQEAELKKYLDTLPVMPPMGWRNLGELLATAQREHRSISYYNANGTYSLHIGKQPKRHQPRCGAKTRNGSPCKMRAIEGKQRCRLHGGLSTGPRTADGRARIAASNRRRSKNNRDKKSD